MNSNTPIYKLVVLGEGRVGKTSMSLKYVRGEFHDDQQSTVNASYLEKVQTLPNEQKVKLAIWDTAGQEKYNAIAPVYYRDAVGAIIVYQITSTESFDKVKKWIHQLKTYAKKDIVITVAGNKSDMENQRKVNHKDAQAYSKQHGANHFVVSAKNGTNIQQVFVDIADRIYKIKENNLIVKSNGRRGPRLRVQQHKESSTKKDSKCCN